MTCTSSVDTAVYRTLNSLPLGEKAFVAYTNRSGKRIAQIRLVLKAEVEVPDDLEQLPQKVREAYKEGILDPLKGAL